MNTPLPGPLLRSHSSVNAHFCPLSQAPARPQPCRPARTQLQCCAVRSEAVQPAARCPAADAAQKTSTADQALLHRQLQHRRHFLAAAGAQVALWPLLQLSAQAEDAFVAKGPGAGIRPQAEASPGSPSQVMQVRMRTLEDSALSVAIYPEFAYNALGGGGLAEATSAGSSNRYNVKFDTDNLNIPDVTARTAKWLGVPMLPGAKIHVTPRKFEGFIDRDTGEVQMQFIAEFNFSAYNAYKAPPLYVTTNLTTEQVNGSIRQGHGTRMNDKGIARLVGVATVPTTTDIFINKFLMLPTETFAIMSSEFTFL